MNLDDRHLYDDPVGLTRFRLEAAVAQRNREIERIARELRAKPIRYYKTRGKMDLEDYARLTEIEQLMAAATSPYWTGPAATALQAEYTGLLEKRGNDPALRSADGKATQPLPPIFGTGFDDDAPGLNALVHDRGQRDQPACLPADRLYRLEAPITECGSLNFAPAGYKIQTLHFPYNLASGDLSSDFAPGEVRLFWFDFAQGDPEMNTTLRVDVHKPE